MTQGAGYRGCSGETRYLDEGQPARSSVLARTQRLCSHTQGEAGVHGARDADEETVTRRQ